LSKAGRLLEPERNAYRVMNKAFDYLDAPVLRITGEDVPMPYAKNLEHLVVPTVEKVITAVKSVLHRV
jgi:pyruvate dehydrogenase E1 component beta subunit